MYVDFINGLLEWHRTLCTVWRACGWLRLCHSSIFISAIDHLIVDIQQRAPAVLGMCGRGRIAVRVRAIVFPGGCAAFFSCGGTSLAGRGAMSPHEGACMGRVAQFAAGKDDGGDMSNAMAPVCLSAVSRDRVLRKPFHTGARVAAGAAEERYMHGAGLLFAARSPGVRPCVRDGRPGIHRAGHDAEARSAARLASAVWPGVAFSMSASLDVKGQMVDPIASAGKAAGQIEIPCSAIG